MSGSPLSSFSWRNVLVATVVLATPILALAGWQYWTAKNPAPLDYGPWLSGYLKRAEEGAKLDAQFADANSDLIADAPSDPAQLIDPAELVFAPIAGSARDTEETWRQFLDHLAKVTSKKVTFATFDNHRPQLDALSEGKLHVTGFNTGFVRFAVNVAGFVPQVALAKADGSFIYRMQVIVPASSKVTSLAEFKATPEEKRRLAVTQAGSHSGFKAPLLALRDEFNLRPGRDYEFVFTGGHAQSIRAIGDSRNRIAAAAVASDLLEEAKTDETSGLKPEQYRVIYESKEFPKAAYGVGHLLKPELAAKVKEAFTTFDFKDTKLEAMLRGSNTTRFVPIDYKKDWAIVRSIDERMLTW
jgi:phosphonate transport system substrate-binding protein